MTVKKLKEWLMTVPEDSVVETERYGGWDALDPKKIRAMYVSSPQLEMEDVCNLEDAEL